MREQARGQADTPGPLHVRPPGCRGIGDRHTPLEREAHAPACRRDVLTGRYGRAPLVQAAGAGGWNLPNNSIVQLITLGLPDEGVHEI